MKIAAFELKDYEEPFFEELKNIHQGDLLVREQTLNPQTMHLLSGAIGVSISIHSILNSHMLAAMAGLGVRYICTRTIGYDHIDVNYAKQAGFKVCNVHYHPHGVAEYTLMLMLMCLRKVKAAYLRANAFDFSLSGLMGRELRNMTVGVLGTGGIGRALIKLLQAFGCKVMAYDSNPRQIPGVRYAPLAEIYAQADIISLHLPMLYGLRHIINQQAIAQMKPGVIIINTARGGLVDAEALIDGVERKHIGALALDVFEDENGIYHNDLRKDIMVNRPLAYLSQFPNVIMTQHLAFLTDEDIKAMVVQSIENLHALYKGQTDIAL